MDKTNQIKSNNIKFEQPLFYNSPYGLRFEIGPTDIEIWRDFDQGYLNDDYFKIALGRAISIFETAFNSEDDISVIYQIFSDGRRKIRQRNFLFKQIADFKSRKVIFSVRRDLYSEDLYFKCDCWRRVKISEIKVQDINHRNILKALINQDFGKRKQPSISGEVYFINHDKDLVLLLYDDRGMDIVATRKEPLEFIYNKQNDWILDHNRETIDKVFL